MTDDLRTLRSRLDASRDRMDRLSDVPPVQSARMMGRVFARVTLPTTTPTYYAVHPVDPGGIEDEGQAGSLTVDTSRTCYFLVLGPRAPGVGDDLIARAIGGRWVASRGGAAAGGGLITTPGCPCPNGPATIFMTEVGAISGWFSPAIHADTFDWTVNILGTVITGWLGRTIYPSTGTGDYKMLIYCPAGSGVFAMRNFHINGTVGIPDPINYEWQIGQPGNTCTPTWQLTNCNMSTGWVNAGCSSGDKFTLHG